MENELIHTPRFGIFLSLLKMCIYLKELSLRVSSAIATPPLLHIELPLPPAADDSTDQILGDLHFTLSEKGSNKLWPQKWTKIM